MAKSFYVIESRWTGFFSNFLHTLQHLRRAEAKNKIAGCIPIIYWHGGCYAKYPDCEENIWEYYFEPVSGYSVNDINPNEVMIKTSKYLITSLPGDPKGCWDYKRHPPKNCLNSPNCQCREFVNGIIRRNIKIKPHIQKIINDFVESNIMQRYTIGVHYRDTKDVRINPEWMGDNPFMQFCDLIATIIRKRPDKKRKKAQIFLATDSYRAIDMFKKYFGDREVIHYDAIRSSTEYPIQYGFVSKENALKQKVIVGPQAGEESLIDCIVLSKCNCMVHGISNLSACAGYFNKDLKSYFAGRMVK